MEKLICGGLIAAGAVCILLGTTASAGMITGGGIAFGALGLFFGLKIPQRVERLSRR